MAVSVRGGAGGTGARLEDLHATARTLAHTADELGEIIGDCLAAGAQDALEAASAVVAPVTWARVGVLRGAFAAGTAGLALELRATAAGLSAAARGYEAAEALAERVLDEALTGIGAVAGHAARTLLPFAVATAAPVVVAAGGVWAGAEGFDRVHNSVLRAFGARPVCDTAGVLERAVEDVGRRVLTTVERAAFAHPGAARALIEYVLPGAVSGFLGLPPGIPSGDLAPWPHDSVSLTRLLAAAAHSLGLLLPTGVRVERRPLTGTAGPGPRTAAEVFDRELEAHRGRANGRVRVDRVLGPDGVERAVVYVPATTDWAARGGRNGTDLTTNVETVAGSDSAMREAVRRALEGAGFRPGSEVMFVGYSQGGIVAGSLAADPAFRRRYRVRGLFTAGSPISDFDIPAGTRVLSVEHADDLVPNLDGGTNPDRSHWTTVTVDRAHAPGESPGSGHDGAGYRRSIDALERAHNRELADFMRDTDDFRGPVTGSQEYEAVRR